MSLLLQGRQLGLAELGLIRRLIVDHPDWSRRRLWQVLCEAWNWRNAVGQLKDMASRTLLVKLQQRGQIQLPARRQNVVHKNIVGDCSLLVLAHGHPATLSTSCLFGGRLLRLELREQ